MGKNRSFVKVDLHIHTPASACYKDEKCDDTYIRILEKAVEEDLKIIAITDHNTLAGYEHLLNIKCDLNSEKKALSPFALSSEDIRRRIEEIDEILALFSKVHILAGVEITLNPGVHIIVIADNDDYRELSVLLDTVGYTEGNRGSDNEFVPDMDIKQFLKSPLLTGKIVFAPHIDRDSGIYKELCGNYRAEVFRSKAINAVSINSASQLEKIQFLVANDPLYKRDSIWAYINASDAHEVCAIGNRISYMNLDNFTFDSLKKALSYPAECISDVEDREIENIIDSLKRQQKTILLGQKECENELDKYFSAALNSGYNSIIIGASFDGKIPGVSMNKKEIDKKVDKALKSISNAKNVTVRLFGEQLGSGRSVYIIGLYNYKPELSFLNHTDEVYIYENQLKKASMKEVKNLVSNQILKSLESFQEMNDETIEKVCGSLSVVKRPIDKYKLAIYLEQKMDYLWKNVNLKAKRPQNDLSIWTDVDNGDSCGTAFYARNEKIMLDNAILRITCPMVNDDFCEEILNKMTKINETCLVVTERGGSYVADVERNINLIDGDSKYLLVSFVDKDISIYSLALWLRSKVTLWYLGRIIGNTQLYKPDIFNNILIPRKSLLKNGGKLDLIARKIVETENAFLIYAEEIRNIIRNRDEKENPIVEEFNGKISAHNNCVLELFAQSEKIIYEELQLTDEQIKMIDRDLKIMGIWPNEC